MLHGSVRSYVHVRVLRGDDVCSGVLVAVTLLMVDTLDWTPLSLSSVTDSRLGWLRLMPFIVSPFTASPADESEHDIVTSPVYYRAVRER